MNKYIIRRTTMCDDENPCPELNPVYEEVVYNNMSYWSTEELVRRFGSCDGYVDYTDKHGEKRSVRKEIKKMWTLVIEDICEFSKAVDNEVIVCIDEAYKLPVLTIYDYYGEYIR